MFLPLPNLALSTPARYNMSDVTGTPGARTRTTLDVTVTRRQLQALARFLKRKTVEGDVALVESVMLQIVTSARSSDPINAR